MDETRNLVGRVVLILQAFSEGQTILSLKQIVERSRLPASTAHRLLDQLVQHGIIERWTQRRYCIGAEFIRMSMIVSAKVRLAEVARPIMQDIAQQLNMTCLLSLYVPTRHRRIPVVRYDPRDSALNRIALQNHQSLVWGAAGRVILAHLPPDVVEIVRRTAPPCPVTGKMAPGRASLNRTLERIRVRGYDSSRGEIISRDIVAVAAPLFGAEQRILGNLAVATANPRASDEQAAADLLLAKSRKLSSQLARIKMI